MLTLVNIVIPAQNFEQTVSFYRDTLNLPVYFENDNTCFLEVGSVKIAIYPNNPDSQFSPTGHGLYLDISIPDQSAMKIHLKRVGVEILSEWHDHIGKFLLIADPEGNLLELIEYVQTETTRAGAHRSAELTPKPR